MTSIRKAALACVASALLALPLSAARRDPLTRTRSSRSARPWSCRTRHCRPGKYLFQLADSPSNRHIVKVMSADRKEIHATLLAIPYYSNDRPSDDPQVRFMETPASGTNGNGTAPRPAPTRSRSGSTPATSVGHEFIYPRSQAMRIASRTGSSVLTTKSETEIESTVADADLTRVDRAGTDTAVSIEASATPSTAASAETAVTPAPTGSGAGTSTCSDAARDRNDADRPDHAGSAADAPTGRRCPTRHAPICRTRPACLPLLAVIGIGSLVGSRWLRRSRRVGKRSKKWEGRSEKCEAPACRYLRPFRLLTSLF